MKNCDILVLGPETSELIKLVRDGVISRLGNVFDGREDFDAVNLRQLREAMAGGDKDCFLIQCDEIKDVVVGAGKKLITFGDVTLTNVTVMPGGKIVSIAGPHNSVTSFDTDSIMRPNPLFIIKDPLDDELYKFHNTKLYTPTGPSGPSDNDWWLQENASGNAELHYYNGTENQAVELTETTHLKKHPFGSPDDHDFSIYNPGDHFLVNGTGDGIIGVPFDGTDLLAAVSIDCTSIGSTDIYTVPLGKKLFVSEVYVLLTAITGGSGQGKVPRLSGGKTAGNIDIYDTERLLGVETIDDFWHFNTSGKGVAINAGEKYRQEVQTSSNATTYTTTVYLYGALI